MSPSGGDVVGDVLQREEVNGLRREPSDPSDCDVVDGVPLQRSEVAKVAGENRRSTHVVSEGDHDGVDCGRGTGEIHGGASAAALRARAWSVARMSQVRRRRLS